MQIRPFEHLHAADTFRILRANGWGHRIPSVDHLLKLAAASQRVMVAVDEDHVVGFARAITDGLSNGYLSMVVVEKDYRGRGIGTALVEGIVGNEPDVTWVLRAGRQGAQEFFSRLGFSASSDAMERNRQRTSLVQQPLVMDIAEFKSNRDGSTLVFRRTSSHENEVEFDVAVQTPHFSGTASATTFINGSPSSLFVDMARDWRGWNGAKTWEDLEGRVKLKAECDRLGHTKLFVELVDGNHESRLIVVIEFDAGQLDQMAQSLIEVVG